MDKGLNCAQKVLAASRERFAVSDELIERFGEYGGGRAPQGWCGALYAAKVLLEKEAPARFAECEKTFTAAAGAATCRAIRAFGD
jgi:hypothetical protein